MDRPLTWWLRLLVKSLLRLNWFAYRFLTKSKFRMVADGKDITHITNDLLFIEDEIGHLSRMLLRDSFLRQGIITPETTDQYRNPYLVGK